MYGKRGLSENSKRKKNLKKEGLKMAEKVLFDAENESIPNPDLENKKVLYDAEEEIKKKEAANRADATPQEDDYVFDEEKQQNVFKDGLNGGHFITRHACPMCGFGKKTISEMYSRKRFSRKKKVIGYAAICANCGFVSFYATNINDLLLFFKGKVK